MKTKTVSCAYCKKIFDSKWNDSRKHFAEYCPECTKQHIWWKKSKPYKYISDEGIVIYENEH